MKKYFILFSLLFSQLQALPIDLKTGNWIFDRYRTVALEASDYSYSIKDINFSESTLELQDDSLWKVGPMQAETKSFYSQKYPLGLSMPTAALLSQWQKGDILIFHELVTYDTFLVYNVTRDRVLDLLPVGVPTASSLSITSITNNKIKKSSKIYHKKHTTVLKSKKTRWETVIVLSDGSVWKGKSKTPLTIWMQGDPILIAKNTPWRESYTHTLMHFKMTRETPESVPACARFRVWRVS